MSGGTVTGVVVKRTCEHCAGNGWVPGGKREYGELVRCGVCEGRKVLNTTITLAEFKKLLTEKMTPKEDK